MAINQLTTANSFNEWLDATSSLIAVANSLTSNAGGGLIANSSIFIQGAAASLNVRTLANINTLRANTAYIANTYFNESNVTIQLDLTVGRNVSTISFYGNEIYQKGVNVSALAQRIEPAFIQANAGFNQANASFIHANSGFNQTNISFIHANSGFIQTNASFNHANSGFNQTNISFNQANSGFNQTNLTFNQANSGFIQANASFNHANSSFANANGAFAAANAAYIQANSGFIQTNASFNHANSGFFQANALFDHANSAFIQANVSFNQANSGFIQANAAFIRANNSLNANTGGRITGQLTVTATNGIRVENAASQDSIVIKGNNVGSSSYSATIIPSTLDGDKVVTIPNETFTVGFRNIPPVGEKTSQYTLAISDVGKFIKLGNGGSIVVPDATFSDGDAITIFNNTGLDATITCLISAAYIPAFDSIYSSMTLSTRGVATVMFLNSTSCVIIGNVS